MIFDTFTAWIGLINLWSAPKGNIEYQGRGL